MLKFRKTICARLLVLLTFLTSAASVSAQGVHPVVDLSENCIVGGTSGGKWLEADALTPLIKGSERYRLYTMMKQVGEVAGQKPESYGEPCDDVMSMKLTPEPQEAIAVGGDWNALPRVPRMVGTRDPVYRQVVAGILRQKGFVKPKINITQVIRIDLDGDGTEEVIVGANHLAGGLRSPERGMAFRAEPGDYSLVFVRKLVRGKVQNIFLVEEYYAKKTGEAWGPPNQNDVAAVLDLNGDGRMEIIIHGGYYEGSWSTVFRLDQNNKFTNVFGCGCGV